MNQLTVELLSRVADENSLREQVQALQVGISPERLLPCWVFCTSIVGAVQHVIRDKKFPFRFDAQLSDREPFCTSSCQYQPGHLKREWACLKERAWILCNACAGQKLCQAFCMILNCLTWHLCFMEQVHLQQRNEEVSQLQQQVDGLERSHENLRRIHSETIQRRRAARVIQRAYRRSRLRNLLKDASAREEVQSPQAVSCGPQSVSCGSFDIFGLCRHYCGQQRERVV